MHNLQIVYKVSWNQYSPALKIYGLLMTPIGVRISTLTFSSAVASDCDPLGSAGKPLSCPTMFRAHSPMLNQHTIIQNNHRKQKTPSAHPSTEATQIVYRRRRRGGCHLHLRRNLNNRDPILVCPPDMSLDEGVPWRSALK
jgi:hypothetical protein